MANHCCSARNRETSPFSSSTSPAASPTRPNQKSARLSLWTPTPLASTRAPLGSAAMPMPQRAAQGGVSSCWLQLRPPSWLSQQSEKRSLLPPNCARSSAQAACTPHERGAAAILQRHYNAKHLAPLLQRGILDSVAKEKGCVAKPATELCLHGTHNAEGNLVRGMALRMLLESVLRNPQALRGDLHLSPQGLAAALRRGQAYVQIPIFPRAMCRIVPGSPAGCPP